MPAPPHPLDIQATPNSSTSKILPAFALKFAQRALLSSNFEKPKPALTTATRGTTMSACSPGSLRARQPSTNRVSSRPYTVSRASVLLLCGRTLALHSVQANRWFRVTVLRVFSPICARLVYVRTILLTVYRYQRNVAIVLVSGIAIGSFSVATNYCHQRRAVLAVRTAKVLNASSESFASLSCATGIRYTTPSVVFSSCWCVFALNLM